MQAGLKPAPHENARSEPDDAGEVESLQREVAGIELGEIAGVEPAVTALDADVVSEVERPVDVDVDELPLVFVDLGHIQSRDLTGNRKLFRRIRADYTTDSGNGALGLGELAVDRAIKLQLCRRLPHFEDKPRIEAVGVDEVVFVAKAPGVPFELTLHWQADVELDA